MIKFNHDKLKEKIMIIFNLYLKNPKNKQVKRMSKKIYNKYANATPLLNKDMQYAVNILEEIGWGLSDEIRLQKNISRLIRKLV
ncbi:MAG: hypothetical protein AB1571_03445 [Nanoarchaeota archaeon]